jgi:glutamate-ammonia-ligase adenylyltransferase
LSDAAAGAGVTVCDGTQADRILSAAFPGICEASPFLQRALAAEGLAPAVSDAALAWLLERARQAWTPAVLRARYAANAAGALAAASDAEAAAARALRRTRRELLSGLLLRDAAGLAPLEEVTGAMTDFAELAVQEGLRAIVPPMAARFGTPVDAEGTPQDLLVLGMGKAGGCELNVSSDLDLIFVYGEVRACVRRGAPPASAGTLDGQEFFDRVGRRLIALLGQADADGFVFRIDMRLRPHGDDGPLTVGTAMLEEYLVREGREWERFAWAKARVICGPVLAEAAQFSRQCAILDAVVQPFVYRKYFDFGAIGAIRELHQRIGAEARRRSRGRADASCDVKLGRGGIREIEFLAQTYAIMRGGREHRLRVRGTVATLRVLAQLGLLPSSEAARLCEDYGFLRRLEHALQYRDDAQTHLIPADPAAQAAVARLLGLESAAAMLERYRSVSDDVARSFDALFPRNGAAGRDEGNAAAAAVAPGEARALEELGFTEPKAAAERLRRLFASARMAAMSPAARSAVERLASEAIPMLAQEARRGRDDGGAGADELLLRWIRLVEVIGRRSTYFSLLLEYPRAHERVIGLLATGGWATEYLLRHPILLDELIDPRPERFASGRGLDDVDPVPGAAEPFWEPWIAQVEGQLLACGRDMERQMNVLRDAHHAQVFRLLLADLAQQLSLEHLADHLSALADGVLQLALRAAWRSLDAAGADAALRAPRVAIVAYGKLGGRELGYASDLDLAFVFDEGPDPDAAERNAALATQLVRRLLTWLTSVTSSGTLFEVDLRLRPDGNAGLLVTPIDAFERYQSNADRHGAWVWEHQALTRARACAGDPQLRERVEQIRAGVLSQERDAAALAGEIVAMRQRMLEGHVNRSGRFDLKHDRGGMVDIEFVVQYLVLAHAHRHRRLLANMGNIGLLTLAAQLGLVDASLARDCAAAYRHYRRLQHSLRLNGQAQARVERERVAAEIASVGLLWRTVLGTDEPRPPRRAAAGGARPSAPGTR